MNIRGIVNSGVPFSVVDGGPSQQMAFEYPNDTYSVLPQSSALLQSAFPTLMLYEQGEMLTRARVIRSPACLEPSTESHILWLSDQVSNIRKL
jgi:hypothetical protein